MRLHEASGRHDDLIANLTGPRRRAVQNAAARARHAEDHVGGQARPGVLVPDLDELERVEAGLGAVLRIQRDRAMVVQIGCGDPDGVQLCADDLQHRGPFWPSAESGLVRTTWRGSCGPAAIIIKSDILTTSISIQGPTKRPLT